MASNEVLTLQFIRVGSTIRPNGIISTKESCLMADWESVTDDEIEVMLFQILLYGDKFEAKRFNKLLKERKQKVVIILNYRMSRRTNANELMDKWTIQEVITDAQKDVFYFS